MFKVYYDADVEGHDVPHWMMLDVPPSCWEDKVLYLDVSAPFERHHVHDFYDDVMACSIYLEELLVHHEKPMSLGINITAVKKRVASHGVDPEDIEKFVIQLGDVEEVLQMGKEIFR